MITIWYQFQNSNAESIDSADTMSSAKILVERYKIAFGIVKRRNTNKCCVWASRSNLKMEY
jgi:hypothetical protein